MAEGSIDRINRRRIEAMPSWRFVCGRDWSSGPIEYAVGFYWARNVNASEGEIIYLRRWILRLAFRLRMDRL